MRISMPLVLAALLAIGVGWYMLSGDLIVGGRGVTTESPAPPAERVAEATAEAVRVRAQVVTATDRSDVLEVRGRSEADARVVVAAETQGRVVERLVNLGDRVATGDLMCQIDRGAREARLAEASATLEQATADYDAATQLNERGFATDIRLKTVKAQFDAAQAAVREARIELERTEVRAPIDGVVEDQLAEIGAMLAVGAPCALVMDSDPMNFIGQVSERDVSDLALGMPALVRLVTGEERAGLISFIGSSADEATRTFRLEITVPNSDGALRSGVTAQAAVELPSVRAHHFSPAYLTLDEAGQIGVRVVDDQSRAKFLPVQLLGEDGAGVWVAGLPESVRIITVGQEFVTDGELVSPITETAKLEAAQ